MHHKLDIFLQEAAETYQAASEKPLTKRKFPQKTIYTRLFSSDALTKCCFQKKTLGTSLDLVRPQSSSH